MSEGVEANGSVIEELRTWYPDPSALAAVAKGMLASIRRAHAKNPRSWCVTRRLDKAVCRLNVGIARVFDIWPGYVRLAINVEGISAAERASLGDKLDHRDELNQATFGKNGTVKVEAVELAALAPGIIAGHDAIVDRAAGQTTPFARFHNNAILDALRSITGEEVPRPELPEPAPPTAYWKVAPGAGGFDWARCHDGSFIALGWPELGDLSASDEADFQRRAVEGRAKHGWGAGVEQAWKFRNIRPGDRIVANGGTSRVLGIGTVVGPYTFAAGELHPHRLPVRWDDVVERRVDMPGWKKTLIRLTENAFQQIAAAPPVNMPEVDKPRVDVGPEGGIDFEGVLTHLENQSLSFPAELVASYLLGLQARRFVLLTGISGTGKTQLALEVARLLSPSRAPSPAAKTDDGVDVVVKPYMVRYNRIVVPARLAREFAVLLDETIKRLDVEVAGGTRGSAALYKDPQRPGLLYVLLSGDLKSWFNRDLQEGQHLRLRRQVDAEGVERLVIDRVGEARPSREPAITSHELVAVRPDWTDGRALLGFYNPLTRQYATTPTLELVLRAQTEATLAISESRAPRPFFLIFDEMNLARVEHYFSDFLSAMESGEAMHLHDDDDLADEDEGAVPTRVVLPPNLFVVGTVNVDETTYMITRRSSIGPSSWSSTTSISARCREALQRRSLPQPLWRSRGWAPG